ncbi:MAG: hypothetical protein EBX63_08915, partial [Betaproteobacteria bacterium]|nr:hypothetical protein [Betaproteobacteria bacterium]
GFAQGFFSVQDLGAQQAAWLLDLHDGMRVFKRGSLKALFGHKRTERLWRDFSPIHPKTQRCRLVCSFKRPLPGVRISFLHRCQPPGGHIPCCFLLLLGGLNECFAFTRKTTQQGVGVGRRFRCDALGALDCLIDHHRSLLRLLDHPRQA